jgi:hypothetical protein
VDNWRGRSPPTPCSAHIAAAIHTLQRVQSDGNERARAFPQASRRDRQAPLRGRRDAEDDLGLAIMV